MDDLPSEINWLRSEIVVCPNCGIELYRVDHSPLINAYNLYCDQCANIFEVDFYDPIYSALFKEMSSEGNVDYHSLMRAVEQRLKPCSCGGQFKHDAPRRCYVCHAEVIRDLSSVDLYPSIYSLDVDSRDPTVEEIAFVEEYQSKHIRHGDIWK